MFNVQCSMFNAQLKQPGEYVIAIPHTREKQEQGTRNVEGGKAVLCVTLLSFVQLCGSSGRGSIFREVARLLDLADLVQPIP
jgi:hypothetical protein